jgi:hypothetical protein
VISDLEARLIRAERQAYEHQDSLRKLKDDADQVGQWILTTTPGSGEGNANCVTIYPVVNSCIPFTLTLHDSYYGDCTLTWDGMANWVGCKMVSYPGTVLCAARSCPIFYVLFGDAGTNVWTLQVGFHGTSDRSGNVCPTAGKTCSDSPNRVRNASSTFSDPGTSSWSFLGGAQGQIYPTGVSPTNTITLP